MRSIATLLLLACGTMIPVAAQVLGGSNTFNQSKRAVYQVQAQTQGAYVGVGTAFAIESSQNETELLTASHVLHPGEQVQPGDQNCGSVSFKNASAASQIAIQVRDPEINVDSPATLVVDDYCRDLAVLSIATGDLPILCLHATSTWRTENNIASYVLVIGYLPPYGSGNPTSVPTSVSASGGSGRFLLNGVEDNGFSGAPVLEQTYGLVIGVYKAKYGDSNFSLASDPQAIENVILTLVPAHWIARPKSQSLADCRGV